MNSFAYGDIFVKASSVAEALEIIRLMTCSKAKQYLSDINYGHVFCRDNKCPCGISKIEYHAIKPVDRQICRGHKPACTLCNGSGWMKRMIRKPRRAFSVRMLKCPKCQP